MVLFEHTITNKKMALRMLAIELVSLVAYLFLFMPHFHHLNYLVLAIYALLIGLSILTMHRDGGFLARVTPTEVVWNSGGLAKSEGSFRIRISSIASFEYQQGEADGCYLRLKTGNRLYLNVASSGIDIMAFANALEKLGIPKVRARS